jgi:hypothetical protein
MPLRLGMPGMWHTHAGGTVRHRAEELLEFSLAERHLPALSLPGTTNNRVIPGI